MKSSRAALPLLALLMGMGLPARAHAASAEWMGLDLSGSLPEQAAADPQLEGLSAAPPRDALPAVPASALRPRISGLSAAPEDRGGRAGRPARSARTSSSRLEDAYAARLGEPVRQFGYDAFGGGRGGDGGGRKGLPGGAAQDDFMLSSGDALTVTFRGQKDGGGTYTIDGEGRLLVDGMDPVTAAGRTLGEVRRDLEAAARATPNTEIFVTLDTVRQIDVLILGHVKKPGRRTLTVFDTALDALEQAGGIDRTGSLRRVKLVRGGRAYPVDLYALLTGGGAPDLSLRDGDRLYVPPVGPTMAVAGGVKRPGIYELPPDAAALSLRQALDLAGGLLMPGDVRFMRMSLTARGEEEVTEVGEAAPRFGDGDILNAAPALEKRTGTVELAGAARKAGMHGLAQASSLSALLPDERAFGPDIYPLIGLIEREDGKQMAKRMIAFPPLGVAQRAFDRELLDGDTVTLFSRAQIESLRSLPENGAEVPSANGEDATPLPSRVAAWLKEHSAYVRGAVREEGAWPVAEGVTLENLIAAAGGMTLEASTSDVEVTSAQAPEAPGKTGALQRIPVDLSTIDPASIPIAPGDAVRVNQKERKLEENTVLIAGQVGRPGRYDLLPGDRMSDLLKRAGGLTREAYPQGAIFSRESERKAEEQRFRGQARNLEVRLAALLDDKSDKAPNADQVGAVQQLIGQLKEAEGVGRITVEADPDALSADPAVDILLERGDRIYIPQRPLTVRVAGEVLSPSSLQFRKEKDPEEYVREAGGFTYNADRDRAFVLYPDGSAQPLHVGAWSHSAAMIPPGSTIVVPRDPKPFDFMETARDITQILGNLAVTGIFVDNINDN